MSETGGTIRIKRVYEEADASDGTRVLVDRLWPRGVAKARAAIDLWDKDIAPSPELRRWWNHDPERMTEFASRYRQELDANEDAVNDLLDVVRHNETVTLVYGARDPHVNHAEVLRRYLEGRV